MTVYDFLAKEGRLPRLDDPDPPWTFKGWALPYVQGVHAQSSTDRWGYFLRTLVAGRLLDEPIPQLRFAEVHDPSVMRSIQKWCELIGQDCGGWRDWRTLLDWLGWSFGILPEPSKLEPARQEKLYRAVNLGPLIEQPSDYLGHHVCVKRGSGWNPLAFFPTPHSVCEMMTQMTMGEGGVCDLRCASVLDPCVGSGRMLLHASNYSLNLWGQDIDPMMCLICKINGVLYAPWLTFPLHEEIVGRPKMAPPPASLPVPAPPPKGTAIYRVDDRSQGLLF